MEAHLFSAASISTYLESLNVSKMIPAIITNFGNQKLSKYFFQNCIKITLRILSSIFNVRTAYLNGLSSSKAFFMVITRSDLASSPNYIH